MIDRTLGRGRKAYIRSPLDHTRFVSGCAHVGGLSASGLQTSNPVSFGTKKLMRDERKFMVVTTINGFTEGILAFARNTGWSIIVIGDKGTPELPTAPVENIEYYSLEEQMGLGFRLCRHLPTNHYSRKNLGYLIAMRKGADVIADIDDDNYPLLGWGEHISQSAANIDVVEAPKIVNVYSLLTDAPIWPRGFPLRYILDKTPLEFYRSEVEKIAIWQGLVEGEPDVDAIYRLINHQSVCFRNTTGIALGEGVFGPINSQNTVWLRSAFAFMYLPVFTSFRFTDILRGYVAQKGIQATGQKIAYVGPNAFQKRNEHDLMDDFAEEIFCYLHVESVIDTLTNSAISGNAASDLRLMYEDLLQRGLVYKQEMKTLDAWLHDFERLLEAGL